MTFHHAAGIRLPHSGRLDLPSGESEARGDVPVGGAVLQE
jgi:hypothetical protein